VAPAVTALLRPALFRHARHEIEHPLLRRPLTPRRQQNGR
jgi:hypothetical protein